MNKEHFLIELKIYLKPLSSDKQNVILNEYDTIFDDRLHTGESEEEIAKTLGKPRAIAEEILSELNIDVPEKKLNRTDWREIYSEETEQSTYLTDKTTVYFENSRPEQNIFIRFLQIFLLLSFNFLFMVWVIFSAFMVLMSGWLSAVLFTLSPILGGFSIAFGLNDASLFNLFISILLCGVGIIGILLLIPLTKLFVHALRTYLHFNIRLLKGEQNKQLNK